MFDIVLRPTQEYFTHMEASPYAGEGLQILAYTRHLWPLSSEGSLTCQHLLRHGTSSFTVSSEGQETDQCSQRDSNSRPHDPKSNRTFTSDILKCTLVKIIINVKLIATKEIFNAFKL